VNGPLPVPTDRIDRVALERILQRAAELQAGEHDIGEGLSPDEVLKLGAEVGIPAHYLRQAMLEEQSRAGGVEPSGTLDRAFGAGEVRAVRVVQGEVPVVERALLRWMEKNELMVIQRHQPGRITWERMGGMQAALRRGMATLEPARARWMMDRADTVSATITELEPGYCHVTLTATLRGSRGGYVGGAIASATLGAAGSGVLAVLGALWIVAAAPVAAGLTIAWAVSQRFRPVAERVRTGLERALDHLEGAAGRTPLPPSRGPGLLEMITSEVRRALGPGADRRRRGLPPSPRGERPES